MGSGKLIIKAIKKYGIENFEKEILEFDIPNVDLANDWEQMYILFERAKRKAEYNIANGGNGKGTVSEETKIKLSEINSGSNHPQYGKPAWNRGKTTPDDVKKKISEANKGHKVSEESRKKMSEAHKGQTAWNRGKTTPDDVKKKMSEANKGKHFASEETRKKMSEAKRQWKVKHWKLVDGKRVWY